ncbi:Lsr2 dimerization domain-containing protein [Streptomyces goshikiensis]|uniref:Lsr2 dimerization domain-containing protein n=1 Tax=Streptomyces goshikiensis TaxID=1942 RepID=UPI0037162E8F
MAVKATPVTEAQKDEKDVQAVEANVPGVGTVLTYFKIEKVDDVSGKPEEDIYTVRLTVPVEVTEEAPEYGDDGEPVVDDEGKEVTTTETSFSYRNLEVDLGSASRAKLEKALAPFIKNAREVQAPAPGRFVNERRSISASSGPNPALTEWRRRARRWLQQEAPASVLRGETVGDKGVLKAHLEEAYVKAHPNDPRP